MEGRRVVSRVQPGLCRYCGCTEDAPCAMCRLAYDGCGWHVANKTVCSGAPCVVAERARKERNAVIAREWRSDALQEAGLRGKKGRAA